MLHEGTSGNVLSQFFTINYKEKLYIFTSIKTMLYCKSACFVLQNKIQIFTINCMIIQLFRKLNRQVTGLQ